MTKRRLKDWVIPTLGLLVLVGALFLYHIIGSILNDNFQLIPLDNTNYQDLPLLPSKIEGTLCVCPTKYYEGFYVAKLRKIN